MALRRFPIETQNLLAQSNRVRIVGDLFHHIKDVYRFTLNDHFEVLPGNGKALKVRLTQIDRHEMWAEVEGERALPPLPKPWVTLALSLPKLPKVDWIVEKAVELGAHGVRPFVSDYSFLRKTSEVSPNRQERWQKLVRAATTQSGRGDILNIAPVTTLEELMQEFNRTPSCRGLFLYEGEGQLTLPQALAGLQAYEQVWVFIGSEGGFSAQEVEMFQRLQLPPVTMGEQVLRVETACLALLSIIKYELGAQRI